MSCDLPIWRRWIPIVLGCVLAAQSAGAISPAELSSQARTIAAELPGARGDAARERAVVEKLGQVVLTFVQISDAAAMGGKGGEELRRLYETLLRPLEEVERSRVEAMEAGINKVIQDDGDLEALYDSAEYQESQQVAAHALYYLNWLRYYGALLHQGDDRKSRLRNARAGFGQFVTGDQETELLVESLLGRGLCALDLGDYSSAARDLERVEKSTKASAERRRKARLALLDTYVRSGNTAGALAQSATLLEDGSASDANWVRFMRVRTLLDVVTAGAAGATGHRREALVLMDRLRRAGPSWEKRITAVIQESFDDPSEWTAQANTPFAKWELARLFVQKEDYQGAMPLLAEVVGSGDPGLAKHQGEARYFLALGKLKAGAFAEAATLLEEALSEAYREHPAFAGYQADATYVLFKAREAYAAETLAPDDIAKLEAAARALVESAGDHAAAFEARFRLAELLHARGEFAAAIDWYAQVEGDAAFEIQSAFGTVQSRFELYKLTAEGDERNQTLTLIGGDLDIFEQKLADVGDDAGDTISLEAMGAKVAVMRAVHAKLQEQSDFAGMVEALAEFEERFPRQTDLLPQVVRLRIEAYRELGDLGAVRSELARFGDDLLATLGPEALEKIAVGLIRQGARSGGGVVNEEAQKAAIEIYRRLAGADGARARVSLTLARLLENTGAVLEAKGVYEKALANNPKSLSAQRGLARIAEAEGRHDDALDRWRTLSETVRAGDVVWYETNYEVARLEEVVGRTSDSCATLEAIRPSMPGLQDPELRAKLSTLYDQVCQ